MAKPGILLEPEPLTARLMRDMARNLERVVVNDLANYETLCRIQQEGRLSKETRVEYADERKTLLFDAFNLETAIDKALKKRVWLPCGGYGDRSKQAGGAFRLQRSGENRPHAREN